MATKLKLLAASLALVAGGALAVTAFAQQGPGFGPGSMGPGSMGMGPGMIKGPGMGHGMMGGAGMRHGMGPGTMGPGMMMGGHGSATPTEHAEIRDLFLKHDRIKRTVTNLPDGIRTVTESDDPELARVIISHVTGMGERVNAGRDPNLPIESEALHRIFRDKDKMKSTYETTAKGVIVVQTSTDPETVAALQKHAAEVSEFAARGMPGAHEAMMRKMGGSMHGGEPHDPRN
jgi:hypothetical protein